MARPLRLELPGGVYHVISRGNARETVYRDDRDRRRFLAILDQVADRMNLACHAYRLMGNHYHLVLETPDANLSHSLRHLNGLYAQYFNRRHDRVGHLFQGRFKSILVEKESYLLTLAKYVVLNPVRAGLVSRAEEWRWSSYRAQIGLAVAPEFLTVDTLLACFSTTNRARARSEFRRFVDTDRDELEVEEASSILGSDAFVASQSSRVEARAPITEIPRAQRFVGRPGLESIFEDFENRAARNQRILDAHVRYGYTMSAIAQHLGLHLATISRVISAMSKFKT